ncbi:MAG: AAA family ATPase, partial [bacterium]|nr:AAA family ATPase [bacterium]
MGYTPKILLHRNEETNRLAMALSDALGGQTPSNVFICGKPGTGKTATSKFIGEQLLKKIKEINSSYKRMVLNNFFEELTEDLADQNVPVSGGRNKILGVKDVLGEEVAAEIERNVKYIYINCKHVDTKYRILTNIANTFITDWKERLPFTGLTTDMVVIKLLKCIENYHGVVIIVLDEVDNLLKKSGDDVLHILSRLNEDLKNSTTGLICISNDANVFNLIDARVNSSLSLDIMVFKPYNAVQLRDILKHRAEKAFNDGVHSQSIINLCAAYAARDNGDARRALSLLMVSGEVAERSGADRIVEEHTKLALEKIETDSVSEVVRTLPIHLKIALLAIQVQHEQGRTK